MLHWSIAIPFSIFVWMVAVIFTAAFISVGALALGRLCWAILKLSLRQTVGGIIGVIIWGGFSAFVVCEAITLGGLVVDGAIGRWGSGLGFG